MQTLHIYVDPGYKACGELYSCTIVHILELNKNTYINKIKTKLHVYPKFNAKK